jgi:UDP-glucose 4-epimerase
VHDLVIRIKPNVIYQLASSNPGLQNSECLLATFETDLRSTVNVLLATKASSCKLLVIPASLDELIYDGRLLTSSSQYAAGRAAATYCGLTFQQLYGVPVAVLWPFMTYGPGQNVHKLIPHTIVSLLQNQASKVSSGVRRVDSVYVEDVIWALITVALRPEAVGVVIDVGSGHLVSVREVVE